jgi:hypothetical protein
LPGRLQLGGELVGPPHPLRQLGVERDPAQEQRGAVGDVADEPLVGRGDRGAGFGEGERRTQHGAVQHRDHVVGVRPGQQHREVLGRCGAGLARRRWRVLGGTHQPVADGQPHDGTGGTGAVGQHLRETRQRLVEHAGPDARGRLRERRVRRHRAVVGEPFHEPVDPGQHEADRHPRDHHGHERQQHLDRPGPDREGGTVDHHDEHDGDTAGDQQCPQQPRHDRPVHRTPPVPRPDRVRVPFVTLCAPATGTKRSGRPRVSPRRAGTAGR